MNNQPTKRLRGYAGQKRRAKWLAYHPLCVACERMGFVTQAAEVDHIVPLFKGGKDDSTNLQSLCKPCHDRKTREDLGWRALASCDPDGHPLDPSHHWNARRAI